MPTGSVVRGDLIHSDEEEFKAHLAQAIRLENVGVLLGAGASIVAGGSSMAKLWARFRDEAPESLRFLAENRFLNGADGVDETENIERIIDRLEIAILDADRSGDAPRVVELGRYRAHLLRAIMRAAILHEELLRDPSTSVEAKNLADHRRLLSRLTANRQPGQAAPWIFTTNYDLAVECAAEAIDLNIINGFGGVHTRRFAPSNFQLGYRNVVARGEAQFGVYNVYLAKLHGSLSWQINQDQSVSELQVSSQWPRIEMFLSGETDDAPGVLIYPGSAKFIESTGFVYGEMIRRFTEYLSRSNTLLIVSGYGFNDFHINRILVSALQNPTLQLIVYMPEIKSFEVDPATNTLTVHGENVSPALCAIIERKLPQVTICGGGERAFFNRMTNDLPQPALIDEQAKRSRELLKLLAKGAPGALAGEGENGPAEGGPDA